MLCIHYFQPFILHATSCSRACIEIAGPLTRLALPACWKAQQEAEFLALCSIVGHFSPLGEDASELKDGDVVKM